MLKVIQTQTKKLTWAASTDVQEDISASGAITRIVLKANINGSATVAGAIQPDGLWRVIQNLKITGSGGKNYLGMSGEQMGRLLHLLNSYDFPMVAPLHDILSDPTYAIFILHFGSRPQDMFGRDNPFDLSAFIPAWDETELKLTWTTTANDVVDDTVTLASGDMEATIYEVLGTEAEIREEMIRQGVGLYPAGGGGLLPMGLVPVSSTKAYAHDADYSDLSSEHNVPTGAYMRRIVLLVQDDTGTRPVRADDEVTRVGIKLPVGNRRLVDLDWRTLVYSQGRAQDLMVADDGVTGAVMATAAGFGIIDLRQFGDPDLGLNLLPYKGGDVKLGMTIANYASGDDTMIFYDQLEPYAWKR